MSKHQLSFNHNEGSDQDCQVLRDLRQWMNDVDIHCNILHVTDGKFNRILDFECQKDLDFIIYCWQQLQIGCDLEWLHANYFRGERLLNRFYP